MSPTPGGYSTATSGWPELRRLAAGGNSSEAPHSSPLELIIQSNRATIHAITQAQKAGKISDRFAPVDLLVLTIAAMWPALTPELTAAVRTHTWANRRQVITDAVSALITPDH